MTTVITHNSKQKSKTYNVWGVRVFYAYHVICLNIGVKAYGITALVSSKFLGIEANLELDLTDFLDKIWFKI